MTTAATATVMVEAVGVRKVFGTGDAAVVALDGVDLRIEPGAFVSLIGPSGSGKSTLLRLIGDLIAPTAGSIRINAKDPSRARLDHDYGMVFQAPVLLDWRTIASNIGLPLEVMGYPADDRRRRAAELLRLVELEAFAERHPWELSGGMQQRVAIARALSFEPKLLLMDEPFGALDEMTRERMNDELLRIWRRTGTTVVFVTHSIAEAVFLSTRVVVMSARPGRISHVIDIDLPADRTVETRESERYFGLVTRVREALREDQPGDDETGETLDAGSRRVPPADSGSAAAAPGRGVSTGASARPYLVAHASADLRPRRDPGGHRLRARLRLAARAARGRPPGRRLADPPPDRDERRPVRPGRRARDRSRA